MKVYKFGGASVRNAAGVRNLAHIVEGEQNLFIIVSAMGKTTNALERVFTAMQKAEKAAANKEIDEIVSNPESPTFENTVVPLELSGEILSKVSGVLFNVSETDRTDELDSVMEKALPMLTEHGDNISFNKGLYERIAKIYRADQSQLNREQQMVLKKQISILAIKSLSTTKKTLMQFLSVHITVSTLPVLFTLLSMAFTFFLKSLCALLSKRLLKL